MSVYLYSRSTSNHLCIHWIGVSTGIANVEGYLAFPKACFDRASMGDEFFIHNWTEVDTTSPSFVIHDLSFRRERTIVSTVHGTAFALSMLQEHLHAITDGILNVNGERLAIIIGLDGTLVLELRSRRRSRWDAPGGRGRNTFSASNVLEDRISAKDLTDGFMLRGSAIS